MIPRIENFKLKIVKLDDELMHPENL